MSEQKLFQLLHQSTDIKDGDLIGQEDDGRLVVKRETDDAITKFRLCWKDEKDYANWIIRNANYLPDGSTEVANKILDRK